MTVSEIQSNISYNENLINQFYAEKEELETQIEELEQLRSKFSTLQNNFETKQSGRKRALLLFSAANVSNKITPTYYSGMNALLSGSEFNSADEGLSTAVQKINAQLSTLEQSLSTCESNLSYRKARKAYWQAQLIIALAQEAING